MHSHRFMLPAFIAFLPGAVVAAPVDLAFKWPVGQPLTYRVTQENKTLMSGMPGGMGDLETGQNQISLVRLVPKEITEDGHATVEAVFESIRLEIQAPMQPKRSYDSANPDPEGTANSLAGPVNAVVGQPLTIVFSPDGTVKSITGVEAISDKMGGGPGAAAFSEQAISKLFEITFRHLPDKPVEPGESWQREFDIPLPSIGTMKGVGTTTLESVEAGLATLKTASTITLQPPNPDEPPNIRMKNMTLTDASGESITTFDTARGLVRRVAGSTTMPIELTMTGRDGAESKISLLVKSATTSELIESK